MATINISDLHPAGSDLFKDSESYMNELGDGESGTINGGAAFTTNSGKKCLISIAVSVLSITLSPATPVPIEVSLITVTV